MLIYGCETCALTLKHEDILLVAEKNILRKILGPTQREDASWIVRKNLKIEGVVRDQYCCSGSDCSSGIPVAQTRCANYKGIAKIAHLGRLNGLRPVRMLRERKSPERAKTSGHWWATQKRDVEREQLNYRRQNITQR